MKICPACDRTYTDDTLAFCLEDGTVLNETYATPNSAPTQFIPAPRPTNQGAANFISNAPVSQPKSKIWIIFPIIALLGIVLFGGIILVAIFKDKIFGSSPRTIYTPPANTSPLPANKMPGNVPLPLPPTPGASAAQLVGSWRADVIENKVSMTIIANLKADGSYDATFQDKQGHKAIDRGTWQFSDGILYQTFSNGASGKASTRIIDKDTFEITIIDNGVPAYNGLKRVYHRVGW